MDYNFKFGEKLGKVITQEDKDKIYSDISLEELRKVMSKYYEIPKEVLDRKNISSDMISLMMGLQKGFLNKVE